MDATTIGVDLAKTVFELALANACAWRIPKFVSILRPCRGLGRIVRCAIWLSLFCICWRQSPG
jgi:hypothetical protein